MPQWVNSIWRSLADYFYSARIWKTRCESSHIACLPILLYNLYKAQGHGCNFEYGDEMPLAWPGFEPRQLQELIFQQKIFNFRQWQATIRTTWRHCRNCFWRYSYLSCHLNCALVAQGRDFESRELWATRLPKENVNKIHANTQIFLIDGLVKKDNSIANALELRLPCTKPSIWRLCV